MNTLPIEFIKVANSMPTTEFNSIGVDLATLIVNSDMCSTKTEARRKIKEGAIKLNDQTVTDPFARLVLKDGQVLVVEHETPSGFTR